MTTTKEEGIWDLDEVYNKINVGGIWSYDQALTTWSWGEQDYGELGVNTSTTRYSSPKQVGTDTTWASFGNRAPGSAKSSALWIKNDGTAWVSGTNAYGILGLNQAGNPYATAPRRSSPTQLGTDTTWATTQGKATGVAYGAKIAIKTDGTMWVWGRSYLGSLGLNQGEYHSKSSPTQIPGSTWVNVSASCAGSDPEVIATKSDGSIWVWGENQSGSLGQNDNTKYSSPVQVPSPGPGTTTWQTERGKFCGGDSNMYAINTDNELWGWGENERGALGLNESAPGAHKSSPVQIPGSWSFIEGGGNGGLAFGIKTDGTSWSWGYNNYGQLGHNNGGPGQGISSPVQLTGTWTKFVQGGWSSYGFKGTDLYAWGPNSNGILGQGNNTQYSSPVQIPGTWEDLTQAGEAVWATQISPAS